MKRYVLSLITILLLCIVIAGEEKGIIIKKEKGNEGRRWAVCIGINNYWDENIPDLKKARNDAKGLAEIFETIGQFDKIYTMTDDLDYKTDDNFPTTFKIKARVDYVVDMADETDLIVFLFSGHGIADSQGKSYLVTADADIRDPFGTSLALDYIVNKLKEKKIKKSLLLIDACREEIHESKSLKASNFQEHFYSQAEIAAVFYATKTGWYSYEDKKSDYGIFSRFLIEGLKGNADENKDGIITFSEIEKNVMEAVFNYALELDMKQRPYTKIYGEKFGDLALTAITQEKLEYKDMVYVEGGTFKMGSNDKRLGHEVKVDSFYIMKYEVIQKMWKEVMGNNPSYSEGDNLPVENISWFDAVEFCNKLSEKEGLTLCYTIDKNKIDPYNEGFYDKWLINCDFDANGYRLPTEAEWEYAARGGNRSKGYEYAGSDNFREVGWFLDNSDGNDKGKTRPVGQKNSNELGIYDMSGNVWEYCWDWYDEDYYRKPAFDNPKGALKGEDRVIRGGSGFTEPCHLTSRFYLFILEVGGPLGPSFGNYDIGLRLVSSVN